MLFGFSPLVLILGEKLPLFWWEEFLNLLLSAAAALRAPEGFLCPLGPSNRLPGT